MYGKMGEEASVGKESNYLIVFHKRRKEASVPLLPFAVIQCSIQYKTVFAKPLAATLTLFPLAPAATPTPPPPPPHQQVDSQKQNHLFSWDSLIFSMVSFKGEDNNFV